MTPTNNSDARMKRGMEIAEHSSISENADGSFSVPSQTREGLSYTVRVFGEVWVCNCPDFENRADQIETCKHAFAVRFWIASRVELQKKPKPKVFADDAIQCWRCGSIRVIRFGSNGGKQSWKCKDCGRRFREQSLLRGSRYSPEMVSLTLDLYFSSMSERKIARTLNSHFGMKTGSTTVHRWIQKFVPMISEYANSLKPRLSDTWHADELFVKMKGGEKETQYKQTNMAYLWNVMDRETRFLLASRLSEKRDEASALAAFNRAVRVAHGNEPERIFTDAFKAYELSVRDAFDKKPEHIAKAGINKPHATNNRMERLNGTLRERVKVQRGWKSMNTPLAEGQRIHYNFVKPHMALDGQTPAERAGIEIEGNDRWLSLLKAALTTQRGAPN